MIALCAIVVIAGILGCTGEMYYERDVPRIMWPRTLLAILLLLLASAAFGQGVPFTSNVTTAATNVPSGAQAPVYTVPGALVRTFSDAACTVPIVAYSDAGMTAPIVPPLVADVRGGFAFYLTAGTYYYSVSSPRTGASLGCYGFSTGGGLSLNPTSDQTVTGASGVNQIYALSNCPNCVSITSNVNNYLRGTYNVNQLLYMNQNVFGPGMNTGFEGSSDGANTNGMLNSDVGVTVDRTFSLGLNGRRMGISQVMGGTLTKHAGGDFAWIYGYGDTRTAWSHPADEGDEYIFLNGTGSVNYPVGTITSTTGTGDQAPVLSLADLAPESFLIDTSKTVAAGTISAFATVPYATDVPNSGGPLYQQPVSGVTLTPSNICETTAAIHLQSAVSYGQPFSTTVGCTAKQGTIANGTGWMVSLNPISVEQCKVTAVSGSNITVSCYKPHGSYSYFFQGGTSGLMSLDPEAAAGWKTTVYAFGSLDSSHLITGIVRGGAFGGTWPTQGYTISQVGSGFHIFPGAEVLAVSNSVGTLQTLGYNSVPWAAGDTFENPAYPSRKDNALQLTSTVRSPALAGSSAGTALFGCAYEGCNAAFGVLSLKNYTYGQYYGEVAGANIGAPNALTITGNFSDPIVTSMPLGATLGDNCGTAPTEVCIRSSSYAGALDLFRMQDRSQRFYFDRTANSWNFTGAVNLGNGIGLTDPYGSTFSFLPNVPTAPAQGGSIGGYYHGFESVTSDTYGSTNPQFLVNTKDQLSQIGVGHSVFWVLGNGAVGGYRNTLDDNAGNINAATGYKINGVAGFTGKCTSPQTPTFAGGIVTGCS